MEMWVIEMKYITHAKDMGGPGNQGVEFSEVSNHSILPKRVSGEAGDIDIGCSL